MAERPTSAAIRALRDSGTGAGGLHECKAQLLKEWRLARLAEIRLDAGELYTVESCHRVILDLVEFLQQVENDHGE